MQNLLPCSLPLRALVSSQQVEAEPINELEEAPSPTVLRRAVSISNASIYPLWKAGTCRSVKRESGSAAKLFS
jgi:hypothetical protein